MSMSDSDFTHSPGSTVSTLSIISQGDSSDTHSHDFAFVGLRPDTPTPSATHSTESWSPVPPSSVSASDDEEWNAAQGSMRGFLPQKGKGVDVDEELDRILEQQQRGKRTKYESPTLPIAKQDQIRIGYVDFSRSSRSRRESNQASSPLSLDAIRANLNDDLRESSQQAPQSPQPPQPPQTSQPPQLPQDPQAENTLINPESPSKSAASKLPLSPVLTELFGHISTLSSQLSFFPPPVYGSSSDPSEVLLRAQNTKLTTLLEQERTSHLNTIRELRAALSKSAPQESGVDPEVIGNIAMKLISGSIDQGSAGAALLDEVDRSKGWHEREGPNKGNRTRRMGLVPPNPEESRMHPMQRLKEVEGVVDVTLSRVDMLERVVRDKVMRVD